MQEESASYLAQLGALLQSAGNDTIDANSQSRVNFSAGIGTGGVHAEAVVDDAAVAVPVDVPLLCEVIASPADDESVGRVASASSSASASASAGIIDAATTATTAASNNKKCTCFTSRYSPHRASQCALGKIKGVVTKPINMVANSLPLPSSGGGAGEVGCGAVVPPVVATRAPSSAAVVERSTKVASTREPVVTDAMGGVDASVDVDATGKLKVFTAEWPHSICF